MARYDIIRAHWRPITHISNQMSSNICFNMAFSLLTSAVAVKQKQISYPKIFKLHLTRCFPISHSLFRSPSHINSLSVVCTSNSKNCLFHLLSKSIQYLFNNLTCAISKYHFVADCVALHTEIMLFFN